jgi:Tfp pilus assembly PilM family ATPase
MAKYGPIGIDISDDTLQVAQLTKNGKKVTLTAGTSRTRPLNIKPATAEWQRWIIDQLRWIIPNGGFHGREAVASVPASQVFIDYARIPALKEEANDKHQKDNENSKSYQAALAKVKQKLPFEADEALIKFMPTENDNAIVIATERTTIDRHLAIYERSNLQINSIAVWPLAITNTYVKFFGRRKTDIDSIVMLLDINSDLTNVVICRHSKLLFARSIPIGTNQLNKNGQSDKFGQPAYNDEIIARLILELTSCRRQFGSIYKKAIIERLIFLSGQSINREIYTLIAKQLELVAQMGDCLAAIEIQEHNEKIGIDRRSNRLNWATAFGLCLS